MTTAPNIDDGLRERALVQVRGRRWVVSGIEPSTGSTLVELQSMEDGRYGDTLEVIWEIEPQTRVLARGSLPEAERDGFDPPGRLAAFLDAVRWSAVTSADVTTLQAPFRSGVDIEDYQLEPVARAVDAPRVNLLLADDVGLGKTIEAGLVAQELLLRHRARRIMVVAPAGLTLKWRDEMAEKFGLEFTIIDTAQCAVLRRERGSSANPFQAYPLSIVSLPWLRGAKAQRLLAEVIGSDNQSYRRVFDLLILDEAHHVAPAAPRQRYAVDSQQTKLIRWLAPHFTHRLFLSATPHNGYTESYTALLEIIDDQRFARGVEPDKAAVDDTVVHRLKTDITNADEAPRFRKREAGQITVDGVDLATVEPDHWRQRISAGFQDHSRLGLITCEPSASAISPTDKRIAGLAHTRARHDQEAGRNRGFEGIQALRAAGVRRERSLRTVIRYTAPGGGDDYRTGYRRRAREACSDPNPQPAMGGPRDRASNAGACPRRTAVGRTQRLRPARATGDLPQRSARLGAHHRR